MQSASPFAALVRLALEPSAPWRVGRPSRSRVQARTRAAIIEQPGITAGALCAALPDISREAINQALWRLMQGDRVRASGKRGARRYFPA